LIASGALASKGKLGRNSGGCEPGRRRIVTQAGYQRGFGYCRRIGDAPDIILINSWQEFPRDSVFLESALRGLMT
jgi:hypothetical protein